MQLCSIGILDLKIFFLTFFRYSLYRQLIKDIDILTSRANYILHMTTLIKWILVLMVTLAPIFIYILRISVLLGILYVLFHFITKYW